MHKRFQLILIAALLGLATVAAVALGGVQIGPSDPNAQVGQYVITEIIGGGQTPAAQAPSAEGGAGGELAFTGLVLLPMIMVAVALILGAVALRRFSGDASDSTATA